MSKSRLARQVDAGVGQVAVRPLRLLLESDDAPVRLHGDDSGRSGRGRPEERHRQPSPCAAVEGQHRPKLHVGQVVRVDRSRSSLRRPRSRGRRRPCPRCRAASLHGRLAPAGAGPAGFDERLHLLRKLGHVDQHLLDPVAGEGVEPDPEQRRTSVSARGTWACGPSGVAACSPSPPASRKAFTCASRSMRPALTTRPRTIHGSSSRKTARGRHS